MRLILPSPALCAALAAGGWLALLPPGAVAGRTRAVEVAADMEYRQPATLTVPTLHASGTLKVTDTTVRFLAPHTELAGYVSDPSTNYFTDLTVGPSGYLVGGAGDVFSVSGNFTNNSTQDTLWNTGAAELRFSGGAAPHVFALAGGNQGATAAGFTGNFAWRTLRLAAGRALTLGDGNANNPGAALYVTRLVLEGGVAQVASITGNGASIYYDPTDAANAPLLNGAAGGTYPLAGGGAIRPVQAAARTLAVAVARPTNGRVVLSGTGTPGASYFVQATTDLREVPFATVATITADDGGAFSYEDTDAPAYPRRFYRVAAR